MPNCPRNLAIAAALSASIQTVAAWSANTPLAGRSYSEIVASDLANETITAYIKQLNERLNRWETVKQFRILPRDFAVETGELTPSMKIKRKVVETTYAPQIESMYAGSLAEV